MSVWSEPLELNAADQHPAAAGWRGHLRLHYTRAGNRTVGQSAYEGPLRVLQPLYPQGPAICHHVLVHPPGGVVAGDELQVDVQVDAGAHALITTPGATRFYRSDSADMTALQSATLHVAAGARLEWLPLEAIAYSGCRATNSVRMALAPGAEMIGWDVLALGLPAARQPFSAGWFQQQLHLPGVWLERGHVAAGDALLASPLGWAGNTVLATLWFACGSAIAPARRHMLLNAAQAQAAAHKLSATAGATSPQPSVVLLRALAAGVEPAMQLLAHVHAAWRQLAWGLDGEPPRIWQT